jgi:hypothetical protein
VAFNANPSDEGSYFMKPKCASYLSILASLGLNASLLNAQTLNNEIYAPASNSTKVDSIPAASIKIRENGRAYDVEGVRYSKTKGCTVVGKEQGLVSKPTVYYNDHVVGLVCYGSGWMHYGSGTYDKNIAYNVTNVHDEFAFLKVNDLTKAQADCASKQIQSIKQAWTEPNNKDFLDKMGINSTVVQAVDGTLLKDESQAKLAFGITLSDSHTLKTTVLVDNRGSCQALNAQEISQQIRTWTAAYNERLGNRPSVFEGKSLEKQLHELASTQKVNSRDTWYPSRSDKASAPASITASSDHETASAPAK